MKKFLLTQQLQSDFLDSLKNNEIKSWCSKYHQHLEHIYDILTPVKIQLQDKKKEAICQYLCSYFLDLLCCLENPDALELLKTDKFRKLREIFKNNAYKPIAQFEHEFVNCLKNEKQRNRFWKSYEKYFDDLILELATRKVLDIGIEGADQIIYRSFRDARKKEREIPWNGDPLDNSNGTTVECNLKPQSDSLTIGANSVNMTQIEEKPDEIRLPNEIQSSSSNELPYQEDVSEDVGEHEDHSDGDKTLSRQSSLSSEVSLEWSRQLNRINEQFQQKMNADNAKYAEEIREIREKRKRMKEKAEDEMRKLKEDHAVKMQSLLMCICMKQRFEQQRDAWSHWLMCVRTIVAKVKITFVDIASNRGLNNEEDNKADMIYFRMIAQKAYDTLVDNFYGLNRMSEEHVDKLFLKVIQHRISQVATNLSYLLDEIGDHQIDKESFAILQCLEKKIDSMDIPTTKELQQICATASMEEYKSVGQPRQPVSHCTINEFHL